MEIKKLTTANEFVTLAKWKDLSGESEALVRSRKRKKLWSVGTELVLVGDSKTGVGARLYVHVPSANSWFKSQMKVKS
jgi:hypothetical protein